MKPTKNLVLIKADPEKKATASGLLIQEDWKTIPPTGVVEAIGPDVTIVKVGDRVIFERYASVIMAEKDMRMCQDKHIMATFNA